MLIKIKDILLNLSNFHTIGKREFEIKFSYSQEVFILRFDTQEECNREFERIEKLLLEGK